MTERYLDCENVPYSRVRRILGEPVNNWLPIEREKPKGKRHAEMMDNFHHDHGFCWLCGTGHNWDDFDSFLEAHHEPGGTRKSDERCCLIMLCRRCHRERVGREWEPRMKWAKWKHDRDHCNWVRWTMLFGMFGDPPEPPPNGEGWTW